MLFFFFSVSRLTPHATSTLSYTTLFRSETGLILQVGSWALRRAALDHRTWAERGLKPPRVAVNVSPIQLRQRDFVRDRKSTRLNSSHRCISYAVFCLKQKTCELTGDRLL